MILNQKIMSADKNKKFIWRINHENTIWCVRLDKIDLNFHDYKFAWNWWKSSKQQIKTQKAIEQEVNWEFIRIDSDKEDLIELSRKCLGTSNDLLTNWPKKQW